MGDLGWGCNGDLGWRMGFFGFFGLRSDGMSLWFMCGEFIGDEVGVFIFGSFFLICLISGSLLFSGFIFFRYVCIELVEEGLLWLFSDW